MYLEEGMKKSSLSGFALVSGGVFAGRLCCRVIDWRDSTSDDNESDSEVEMCPFGCEYRKIQDLKKPAIQ